MTGHRINSSHRNGVRASARRLAAASLLAASLAGCASMSDQTAANLLIDPGRYKIYTCQDVIERAEAMRKRQLELEQLMSRAAQGAGGEFINTIAYRSEYASTRAELQQLSQVNADKQCSTSSQFSSGRAIF